MSGVSDARLRTRRAIISALAGGGLTAIGLGGPLSGAALASEPPTDPASTTGTSTTSAPEAPTQTTTTSTTPTDTTTPPPAATTTTPVSEPPASTTTTTTAPAATTPAMPTKAPTSTAQTPRPPVNAPKVVVQRTQQASEGETATPTSATTLAATQSPTTPAGSGNIAPAPQLATVQSEALAAMMADSTASAQALGFYRIPLFLLPIYQAAAVQYGVPWQILAAINEVETNFGTDLSLSTAGAVGWMQFMPETWLQYGVDALNAGYADPYNPVDAIFAAARYLHAAGASTNLRAAILAYNHSEAYAESVLLRARLFTSYPASVIATLTGLTEGSMPVAGAQLSAGSIIPQGTVAPPPASASSATAGATLTQSTDTAKRASHAVALPGSTAAPSPAVSAARAERALDAAAPPSQLSELVGRRGAPVVAVEDGRVVGIGVSRKLGRYLVLRDTYGDVFTYAGLGSIAPRFRLPKPAQVQVPTGALQSGETGSDPTPTQAATAGRQLPLTLHVSKRKAAKPASTRRIGAPATGSADQGEASVSIGKVRVFAHPTNNPDAIAAARLRAREAGPEAATDGWMKLGRGSVVAQGTVLGHLGSNDENADATLRFAIRPAGAQSAIDPSPILANWKQLDIALHPQGAKDEPVLAGATASDAFLLSRAELQRAVLADPDIKLGSCDRDQVSAGKVGRQALALLVFLSRSGLKPTVGELRCGHAAYTAKGLITTFPSADTVDIAAINGVPIASHQGTGSITDITIRTLLTIQPQFAPKRIVSLMKYPGAPSTLAAPDYATYIKVELGAKTPAVAASKTVGAKGAHTASVHGSTAPANLVLDTAEWQRLIGQVGALQPVKLLRKPSESAIRDKQAAPGNRGLGTRVLP